MDLRRSFIAIAIVAAAVFGRRIMLAEIPVPDDAPQPLPPAQSANSFRLPEGFRMELVAAEPLIRQPSGVCWDAQGRLYVSELHGYNLEGHYDILELNKTGELDHIPRRIQASPEAHEAAKPGMFGVVKRLVDHDGDGLMDEAVLFADRLPPCHGICPARDGIIATCSSEILFLADRDGDGQAEVREVLYKGFWQGGFERRINSPTWGLGHWIYISSAGNGGKITGSNLPNPVPLPRADYRIREDGSMIEPVSGVSWTFGAAWTERGERIVTTTNIPAVFVAPIPWQSLGRNRNYAAGDLEMKAGDPRTYPVSRPHPWRTRRAEDPEFSKLYTDRYGHAETAPNGYFTSACSPFVYQDHILPGLHGHLFTCEPAQNMVHRSLLHRDGTHWRVTRVPEEEQSEFLASTDSWFNPISLAHGPDGCIYLVDFYREIIEDYSAIPRYLQQEYGLNNGHDRGRIWRLTHRDASPPQQKDLTRLSAEELVAELQSPLLWRRQTAQRLLVEGKQTAQISAIARIVSSSMPPAAVLNALYTLEALNGLSPELLLTALASSDAGVRIHAARLAEPWLDREPKLFTRLLELAEEEDLTVVLQAALSLGESNDPRTVDTLTEIARRHGDAMWMDAAIMSSLADQAGNMLQILLTSGKPLAQAAPLLEPLTTAVATRRDPGEVSDVLMLLPHIEEIDIQRTCWAGLAAGFSTSKPLQLSQEAVATLREAIHHPDFRIAAAARTLLQRLLLETPEERTARIARSIEMIGNIQATVEERLAVVAELAAENDAGVTAGLLGAIGNSTPQVRGAILNALFSRQDRLPTVMANLENGTLSLSALSAVQRSALLDHPDLKVRDRAKAFFATRETDVQQTLLRYTAALKNPRDPARGAVLYGKHCGICHQAHGLGVAVGPDLSAESRRAEETILRDIIEPSSSITAGYNTYSVITTDGRILSGLLAAESASGITLKQPEGKTQIVLRQDIEDIRGSDVSLMPDNLIESLKPQDVADILAWLRSSPEQRISAKEGR